MTEKIKRGGSVIRWSGDDLLKHIGMETEKRLKLAAEIVANDTKRNISKGRPASQPGEFPHVRDGGLRRDIFWEMRSDDVAIVGSPLDYAVFLEMGTSKMAPRPFLRRTLTESMSKVQKVFTL